MRLTATVAVAVAATWSACRSDSRPAPRAVSPQQVTAQTSDPLAFDLIAPTEARLGRGIPIGLRLTNVSTRGVDAHFLGRTIAFDIIVTAANGTVVWRRLGDSAVPSILQIRTLAPGETMEWHDTWLPRAAGRYRAQGVLPSDDPEPRRTPWVTFDVSP